jgi:hypothetical protein
MKKTIIFFLSLFISAVLIVLPYKEYPTLLPGSNVKIVIYRHIVSIFTEGLWAYAAFLFVLLPSVLLIQIGRSPLTVYKKALFLVEGILALLAAFLMLVMMSINPRTLAELVIIKPMFYLSLCWVLLGAITSILLAIKSIYDKIGEFLTS